MDLCYYNIQIKDELDGAAEYIKKAINLKDAHPEWASIFVKMSEMELEHAKNLLDIFTEDSKTKVTAHPDSKWLIDDFSKVLNDMYSESVAKVKYMHEVYSQK